MSVAAVIYKSLKSERLNWELVIFAERKLLQEGKKGNGGLKYQTFL